MFLALWQTNSGVCRPQSEKNPSVQKWGEAPASAPPGTRGVVRKADSYDPIRKFTHSGRLPDKPPNYIRDADVDKDDSTSFELPNFENMEGTQWSDESLQFNNVTANKSGSHLDEWQRDQDSTDNRDQTDWRAWGKAIRQEEEEQGTLGTAPRGKVSLEELAASNRMARTKNAQVTGSQKSAQRSADVYPARSFASDSPSIPSSTSPAGQNPFADGGEFDEWGTASPGSGQQQTGAFADQSQSGARQNRAFPKPPQQPSGASSSSGRDSWSTDGFDFADMNQDAIDKQARDQPQRARPRADPRAVRAAPRQQPAAKRHERSTSRAGKPGGNHRESRQANPRQRSDREDSRDSGVSDKVREDFNSIWNDF